MNRKEFLQQQMIRSHAYALKWHASIISGSYRERQLQRGIEGGGWRDMTDAEKLKEAEVTLKAHVDRVQELGDLLEQEG